MSRESYIRGFCKVAEAHGVDPVALAKCSSWFGGGNKEVDWYAGDDIKSVSDLANDIGGDVLARFNKKPSEAFWMMQFSDKNPDLVEQYTDFTPFGDDEGDGEVTEEQRKSLRHYKARMAAAMRKEKIKRLLLHIVAKRKSSENPKQYKADVDYRYAIDDAVRPDRSIDGVSMKPLWRDVKPIDLSK